MINVTLLKKICETPGVSGFEHGGGLWLPFGSRQMYSYLAGQCHRGAQPVHHHGVDADRAEAVAGMAGTGAGELAGVCRRQCRHIRRHRSHPPLQGERVGSIFRENDNNIVMFHPILTNPYFLERLSI